jgi:hypothetical protein
MLINLQIVIDSISNFDDLIGFKKKTINRPSMRIEEGRYNQIGLRGNKKYSRVIEHLCKILK